MRWTLSLDRRLATQFGLKTAPAQELYSSKHKHDFKSRQHNLCVSTHGSVCLRSELVTVSSTCMTNKAVAVTAVKC